MTKANTKPKGNGNVVEKGKGKAASRANFHVVEIDRKPSLRKTEFLVVRCTLEEKGRIVAAYNRGTDRSLSHFLLRVALAASAQNPRIQS